MNLTRTGENFADIVYNAIIDEILYNNLKAGDKINDMEMAAKLGYSRTPVREALIMLEQDGFVKTIGRDGTYVRDFTKEDIREIYIVREALEVMAARLGAKAISDDNLSLLADIVNQMERLVKEENFVDYSRLDIEFHKLVVLSGNVKMLSNIYNNLGLLSASIKVRGRYYIENIRRYNEEHRLIYEAFLGHDGDLAETLLRSHIQNGKMDLLLNRNKFAYDIDE